jgi:ribosomal subunit interface protein
MSIHIQARGFTLTNALTDAVRSNLMDVLEAYRDVEKVDVRLEDINSRQHGGIDKRCQVVLKLAHAPTLIMRSTQHDMYLAIRHCASRVKHTLRRNADKKRKQETLQA